LPDFHPQVKAMLRKRKAMGAKSLAEYDGPEARKALVRNNAPFRRKAEAVARVESRGVKGPGGEIPIRIYWPEGRGPFAVLVFFHGGGWVAGSIDEAEEGASRLANRSKAIVISVDYRLAPEHRFPAAVEDCFAVTEWAHRNAAALGGDPGAIAVGGASAGANLAAVVCLVARDTGSPAIAHQVLVYPITDYTREMGKYEDVGFGPTPAEMKWFGDNYLRKPANAKNPLVSPLLGDLHGLPPATIVTAEYDTLTEQTDEYAKKLRRSGVKVQKKQYAGMVHGFFGQPGYYDASREAIDFVGGRLRRLRSSSRSERTR
jgi:acetyl esterase